MPANGRWDLIHHLKVKEKDSKEFEAGWVLLSKLPAHGSP